MGVAEPPSPSMAWSRLRALLRASFADLLERFINLKTMSWPLRALVALATALIVASGVVVAVVTQVPHQPTLVLQQQSSLTSSIPIAALVISTTCLSIGLGLLAVGALRLHWSIRLVIAGAVTLLLARTPIETVNTYWTTTRPPYPFISRLYLLQLALAGCVLLLAIVSIVAERTPLATRASTALRAWWHVGAFLTMMALLGVYAGLEYGIYSAMLHSGGGQTNANQFLGADLATDFDTLTVLAGLITLWSSVKALEIADTAAHVVAIGMARLRAPWWLYTLVTLAAIGTLADSRFWQWPTGDFLWSSLLSLVMVGIFALLFWAAGFHAAWPQRIPLAAMLVGAVTLFIVALLIPSISLYVAPLFLHEWLASGLFAVAALVVGCALIAHGRMTRRPVEALVGLVLAMVIVDDLLTTGPKLAIVLFQFHGYTSWTTGSLPTFQALAGVGALIAVAALLLTRRKRRAERSALVALLYLLIGVEALTWLSRHYFYSTDGPFLTSALIFLLALLWDLFTSGKEVTNQSTRHNPRAGRVLLYLGYALSGVAIFLYDHLYTSSAGAVVGFSDNIVIAVGLLYLGVPLVIYSAAEPLVRLWPVPADARASAPAAASRAVALRRAAPLIAICLCGLLILGALGDYTVTVASPRMPGYNETYTTHAPALGCDLGPVQWISATTSPYTCGADGVTYSLPQNTESDMLFSPLAFGMPQTYQASATFDLSQVSFGCGDLVGHAKVSGQLITGNVAQVCSNGVWHVVELSSPSSGQTVASAVDIGVGAIAPAAVYTLSLSVGENGLELSINGHEVLAALDPLAHVAGSAVILSAYNGTAAPEKVIVRDFSFTPRETPVRAFVPVIRYHVPTPGPACDHGGGSWTWNIFRSPLLCTPSGLAMILAAGKNSTLNFNAPSGGNPRTLHLRAHVALVGGDNALCASVYTRQIEFRFNVCRNGQFYVLNVTRNVYLAEDSVPAADAYTLDVRADGRYETFQINGAEVASVTDDAPPAADTSSQMIGIQGYNGSKQPGSVVFSDFLLEPIPQASALAPRVTYRAAIPACGGATAGWKTFGGAAPCEPQGLRLSAAPDGVQRVRFSPVTGLARDYQISYSATLVPAALSCVYADVRGSGPNFYETDECSSGYVGIQRSYASDWLYSQQSISTAPTHHVVVTVEGPYIRMSVDGVEVATARDTHYTASDYIEFGVLQASSGADTSGVSAGASAQVWISNFTYAPLP